MTNPLELITLCDHPFISPSGNGDHHWFTVSDFIREAGDLDGMTAPEIAHIYAHVKSEFDKLDANKKELSKFVELIKTVKLPQAFERDGVKTFTLEDGTRVTKSDRTFASIVGDQEEAFEWLRNVANAPDMIKLTVNSSSLSGLAGKILKNTKIDENGMLSPADPDYPIDMPSDLFKVELRPTTSVVKSKK